MSPSATVFPLAHIAALGSHHGRSCVAPVDRSTHPLDTASAFRVPAGRAGRRPRGASCGDRRATLGRETSIPFQGSVPMMCGVLW